MASFEKAGSSNISSRGVVSYGNPRSTAPSAYQQAANTLRSLPTKSSFGEGMERFAEKFQNFVVQMEQRKQQARDQTAAMKVSSLIEGIQNDALLRFEQERIGEDGGAVDAEELVARFSSKDEFGKENPFVYEQELEKVLEGATPQKQEMLRVAWQSGLDKLKSRMEVQLFKKAEKHFEKTAQAFIASAADSVSINPTDENINSQLRSVDDFVFGAMKERGVPDSVISVQRRELATKFFKDAAESRYNYLLEDSEAIGKMGSVSVIEEKVKEQREWLNSGEVKEALPETVRSSYSAKLERIIGVARDASERAQKEARAKATEENSRILSAALSDIHIFGSEAAVAASLSNPDSLKYTVDIVAAEKSYHRGVAAIETLAGLHLASGDSAAGVKAWRESQLKSLEFAMEVARSKNAGNIVDPRNLRGRQ